MRGDICTANAQRVKYIITDFVMISLSFLLFNFFRCWILSPNSHGDSILRFVFSTKLIVENLLVCVGMSSIYALSGFYNRPFEKSRIGILGNTISVSIISSVLIYFAAILNDILMRRRAYFMILVLILLLFVFVYAGRMIINNIYIAKLKKKKVYRTALIIGFSSAAKKLARTIENNDSLSSTKVIGFIRLPEDRCMLKSGSQYGVWPISDIRQVCEHVNPDELIISSEIKDDESVLRLLDNLLSLDISIKIAPNQLSYVTSNIRLTDILGTPFVDLTSPRLSLFQSNLKRVLDVLISMLTIVFLSPVYAVISMMVKSSSPGPVFYKQERLGRHHKPFRMYKFRTMYINAEDRGPQLTHDDDPRVTSTGKILRKYRLDELPQFWNVLRGDMSLVGPRPERDFYVRQIVKRAPYYSLLYQVRPGLTSWGMVKYGYASNVDQMIQRLKYDLLYLNNMSLATDIKILTYTVRTVITGEGK